MADEEVVEPVTKNDYDTFSIVPTDTEASSSSTILAKKLVQDIIGTGDALNKLFACQNAPEKTSEVPVEPPDNLDTTGAAEQTSELHENTTEEAEGEDLSSVHSRELKSLLALSKEANLDTNIPRKRKSSDYRKKYKISEASPKQTLTPKLQNKVFQENRSIRYPVTAESELEIDYHQEDSNKNDENSTKTPKRKKANLTDSSSVGGAVDESTRKIGRKSLTSEIVMFKPNKDMFCWRCHRDGVNIACETCVRSYHQKCLKQTIGDPKHWPCPECVSILKAESTQTRSEAMKGMTLEHLCGLLKFAVNRMIQCPGSEPFIHPVNYAEFPEYKKYIIQPMDLTLLEKNIKENLYGSTQAFEADAKWILHNSIIFNSYQSKLTNVAKNIIKICKQEMAEIENCPSCYLNANTKKNTWFTEVCPKPHLLVWAKLRGFPYWPGKAMSCKDNMVDVRFFGAHDKAWVPEKECYLYCEKDPNGFKQKRNDIEACIEELSIYVRNLTKIYGEFHFAPYKTPINPLEEVKQLQIFIPNYKVYSTKMKQQKIIEYFKSENEVKTKQEEPEEENTKNKEMVEHVSKEENVKIKDKEAHVNNNKDTMDGYGTDDESFEHINTERRNLLRYNKKQSNEIEKRIEADEDDTQVPSNIQVESNKGNVKTKGFSNFPGQLKFISHRSFEAESSSQKRHSVEEPIITPPNLSRRNSEASNKSDSSKLSNISDKISRIDIPENMELSLGNENAGGVSISENVSSSNSECSRSENEIEIKKRPVQVDIENSEFTISPANKLKISDKLMKRLSDEDQDEPIKIKDKINEVKRNIISEKPQPEVSNEVLKDSKKDDSREPSTYSQEEEPSTSFTDNLIKMNTEKVLDICTTRVNTSISPNFIEELNNIKSISSKPPHQIMEDAVDSSNKDEDHEMEMESDNVVVNKDNKMEESPDIIKDVVENEDESDDEVLSKLVPKKDEPNDTGNKEKERKSNEEPSKTKVGLQSSNAVEDKPVPSHEEETSVKDQKPMPEHSPKKIKVIIKEPDTNSNNNLKPVSQKKTHTVEASISPDNSPKKNSNVSKIDSGEMKLTSTAKTPTVLLIKKSKVEDKNSSIQGKINDEKVDSAKQNNQSGNKKTEPDSETGRNSKENSVSPKKISDKEVIKVVKNIVEQFDDDEYMDTLDESQINNENIIDMIHSSLKDPKAKTSVTTQDTSTSAKKKRKASNEEDAEVDTPHKKILRVVSVEKILIGESNHSETTEAKKPNEKPPENSILLKSLQAGRDSRKKSTETAKSINETSQIQIENIQLLTDEIKSEPESETESSEPENLEAKKQYLSALNIQEKGYEKEKSKPHEIRTRSKTEEKREKFKLGAGEVVVVDNLTRVIDHVAVNYSAQHDGEALPTPKKPDVRKIQPQISNQPPKEGEIFVKSFAKLLPKQRARKSFPSPNYTKIAPVKTPEIKPVSNIEPTTTIASTARIPSVTLTTTPSNQQNVQRNTKTPSTPSAAESPRTLITNGTQPQAVEPIRTTNGYIILQQQPVQQPDVVLLPPNQTITYTTTGVSVPAVLQMAPCIVSGAQASIKSNITWASPSGIVRDPNVISSQNYIPQNENNRLNPSVSLIPTQKSTTASNSSTTQSQTTSTAAVSSTTNTSSTDEQPSTSSALESSQPEVSFGLEGDEFRLLNSLVPGNVNKAVSELLKRAPPKLKPRPPGALSTCFSEGTPSSAGGVTSKINSVAHRLGDYFRGMLIETLGELGTSQCSEATITSLKLEIEALKHKHTIELTEIEKNITTVLKDIQRSIVEDRERIVEETRASCEAETIQRIEEAKSKQWCANCSKEAQFYCCWNTSYCDYPCQQKHWPQHMNKCTQSMNGGATTSGPAPIRPAGGQQLILRPANPPPKGSVGRIITKPLQKVYMNRNIAGGAKTMKVQTPSGTQLTVMETTPGNFQVVGGPITVRNQTFTTLKQSNTLSSTAASSSNPSNQPKTPPTKATATRVISHTLPVTTVLEDESE